MNKEVILIKTFGGENITSPFWALHLYIFNTTGFWF